MTPPGPYAATLGITLAMEADGPLLTMAFGEGLLGRPGFLHGGAIAGLLEAAGQAALRHALGGEDAAIAQATMTVDFLRAGLPRPCFARGTVTRLGRRVANVEAVAWQDDPARPIGRARMNLLVGRAALP